LDLPDNAIGNNAIISIRRGDVTGMSFGMTVPAGGERWYREGGQPIRELSKIKLLEISITAFPAYENTHVAIRHFHDWQHELRKMKQWLAEATL
jgi:HK97 family phage prohead protease